MFGSIESPVLDARITLAVMGILERGGEARANVIPNRRKKSVQAEVKKHVVAGSALYTDALLSYEGLASGYAHQVIDHAVKYVDGRVHTNGLENFWSLLKRGISGTYLSVEPLVGRDEARNVVPGKRKIEL